MTQTAEYILSLIRALMREQPVPPVPEGLAPQELFDFSKKNAIEALVFRGLPPDSAGASVRQRWEERANLLLAQSIVQLQERDELTQALTAAGIEVLPLKGCWLKERYPDLNDRQMSDLDMLIHPEDAPAAERILLSMGYRKEEVCFHHTAYHKPPYTAVELHVSLLPETDEHAGYYENIWEKAVPVEGTPRLFALKPEDEYLFYLVHLSKHLSEGGSGLRSILDDHIYCRCFPDLDAAYLEKELETLGLGELARQVRTLSRCWFETGEEVPEALRPLAGEICGTGIYGSLETRTRQRMERMREQYRSPAARFFAYSLPRFFRPLPEMKRRYPVLEKAPILLPVFWVARVGSMMIHNERGFWQHLRLLIGKGGDHG